MMFIREGRLPPIGPPGLANRNVQLPADMEQVLPFYVSRAPERLPAPEPWPDPAAPSPVTFTRRVLSVPGMPGTPAVSHVRLIDLDGDRQLDLLGTDMRQGLVFSGTPGSPTAALVEVASIPHPAHVTVADVDKDGVQDLLVAEMGEFFPADHAKGAVIWMRGLAKREVRRVLARWLAPGCQRRCRGFQRRRQDRSRGRRLRVAKDRAGRDPREPHRQSFPAVFHDSHDRSAGRQHPAGADRSEPRRPDGLRHAARPGARDRARVHQQGRRRLLVRAESDLRRPAPELGLLGLRARRSRQGRRRRRPAHARRHLRRRDREAVSRDPVAGEHGRVSVR